MQVTNPLNFVVSYAKRSAADVNSGFDQGELTLGTSVRGALRGFGQRVWDMMIVKVIVQNVEWEVRPDV